MENKEDLHRTRKLELKSSKKKRTWKTLTISLGTLAIASGVSVGIVFAVKVAKDSNI